MYGIFLLFVELKVMERVVVMAHANVILLMCFCLCIAFVPCLIQFSK